MVPPRLLLIPLFTALAAGLALAASGAPPSTLGQAAAAQARPNIVVIETDDQTLRSMRVMNNVNSLIGDRGARFRRSFVNYSLCCPSRATFLTGQYMHNHRVFGNSAPTGGFRRFQALHGNNNLAVWLRRAGYYTAMIGRYLNGYVFRPLVPPGWSEWRASANQKVYGYTLDENGAMVRYGTDPADFKQDVLTGKAVNLVNRRAPQAQPFFLWLTYTAPHIVRASELEPAGQLPGRREAGAPPRPRVRHRAAAAGHRTSTRPTSPTSRPRSAGARA